MLSEFLCFMVNYPLKRLLKAQSFNKLLKRSPALPEDLGRNALILGWKRLQNMVYLLLNQVLHVREEACANDLFH